MSSKVKVSVCIPVYGVEKYIEKCARTLFEQTLPEMEFIFVDDCSPDRSIEILQRVLSEYPHRKEQVKIIRHEKNGGLVAARNTALKYVSGEYIIHCDSDDWVELDMYEVMYNKAKESDADMVYCSYVQEHPNGKRCYGKISFCDDPVVFLNRMYIGKQVGFGVNKLYKRDIALHESINCPDDVIMCEDHLRNTFMLPLCKKIVGVPNHFYHYRKNLESCCNNNSREWAAKKIKCVTQVVSFAENNPAISRISLDAYKCFCLEMCIVAGNLPDIYRELFPDSKKNIFAKNIPLKLKIVLSLANHSYCAAHLLRRGMTFAKEFYLRFFG